ncbi:helix-turn-helix domain-containing protein [Actinomadura sp. DSM 109109]|nr:helix-turn-helix domain-containing protein [Actinomadura lepetitiana]
MPWAAHGATDGRTLTGEPAGRALRLEPGAGGSAPGGSTVQRILLGSRLRRLREEKGISAEDAGYAIRASQSKISRMEHGRVGFKVRDVSDLLTLYGVNDEAERASLLESARQANSPAWWHLYSDILPPWFETYVGLEEASSLIRGLESRYVPDLLQTEEYARALAEVPPAGLDPTKIARRLDFQSRRRYLLRGDRPPRAWFLLDEAVLHREVGGAEVMRGQLRHLVEIGELDHVTVQVLPSAVPRRENGPFSLLRFADESLSDVVFIEHSTSGLYLDRPSDVDWYVQQFSTLGVAALRPRASLELIHGLLSR